MTKKRMKTVKAWAIISHMKQLRCAVSGRLYLYLSKKNAKVEAFGDDRIVRVSISELPPKRKGKR